MFTTYKLMRNCTNDSYLKKSLEDLVEDYKKTDNPMKRSKIVAAMFCNVFPMILKIQEKYYSLTNDQKVDHAIFHLIRSIRYYDNKKNKVKFSSFYYTHLTNQMKTLLTTENSLKKAAFQNIVRNNDEVLTLYTQNAPDKSLENDDRYYLSNLENNPYFSSEEKEYCSCILAGYTKTKEIAEKLNLEDRYNLNKGVTNPLAVIDLEKQEDLRQKAAARRIRKIKESIRLKREKYKALGVNIFDN